MNMNRRSTTALIGGAIAVAFAFQVYAETKENPYQVIIDRNPFGLREPPPPPPPPTNEPPPPPPLDIKLTGISTLLGPAKVFLEFTDPQTKKVDRPSAMLEGEIHKNVTIVAIDPENNRVKIKTPDTERWLDFEKNGIKPTGGATAAAGQPGIPGKPLGVPPAPGVVPPAPGVAPAGAASAAARGGLTGGGSATAAPATPYAAAAPSGVPVSSVGGLPPRPLRTDAGAALIGGSGGGLAPTAPTAANPAPAMTAEQAQQIIEARRIQLQQQGNPMQGILPPTQLGRQLQNTPTPPAPR